MIKLDTRGRRANNEELAELFHTLTPGDVIDVYGITEEAAILANSLSRTHKRHNKARFTVRHKANKVTITCIKEGKPKKIILI